MIFLAPVTGSYTGNGQSCETNRWTIGAVNTLGNYPLSASSTINPDYTIQTCGRVFGQGVSYGVFVSCYAYDNLSFHELVSLLFSNDCNNNLFTDLTYFQILSLELY